VKFKKVFLIGLILILSGCASLTVSEIEDKRKDLDTMAETAIKGLTVKDELLQSKLDSALAYGVANMKVTKVPMVGAGAGQGARSYKALMVINDQKILDEWKDGKWVFEAGAEASATARVIKVKINKELANSNQ
jgi:hypothetical protein